MKKFLVAGIIFLFVGASIIPSTIATTEEARVYSGSSSRGYIQGLINNASDGDTIFIPGGVYYENIIINKSISLVGEDKNTTIIDGSENGTVVSVSADWVNISGFTIQNSGEGYYKAGVLIWAEYVYITNNIINNNENGIILRDSNINITGNIIIDNNYGISSEGLYSNNIIIGNNITNNRFGVALSGVYNKVLKNNFLNNKVQAFWVHISNGVGPWSNKWDNNYWGRPRILPKFIFGIIGNPPSPNIYWFVIDWRPAFKPYDIEVY